MDVGEEAQIGAAVRGDRSFFLVTPGAVPRPHYKEWQTSEILIGTATYI